MDPVERWQDLLASIDADDAVELLEIVDEATGDEIGARLGGAVDGAFSAQLISDDPVLDDNVKRIVAPLVQRAAAEDNATSVAWCGVVAASVLLAAQGGGSDPEAMLDTALPIALASLPTLVDTDVIDYALACVALGADDVVVRFTGGPIPVFEPGLAFGPDKQSFARYLVAAAAAEASMDDVNSAWTSFVADFPSALEAQSVRWSALLLAGFAVFTRFADYPRSEVLAGIRAFVHAVAEA